MANGNGNGGWRVNGPMIIQGAALAILIWVGRTTLETAQEVAVLRERVEGLRVAVQQATAGRYTAEDAARDRAAAARSMASMAELFQARYDELDRRLTTVEDRG